MSNVCAGWKELGCRKISNGTCVTFIGWPGKGDYGDETIGEGSREHLKGVQAELMVSVKALVCIWPGCRDQCWGSNLGPCPDKAHQTNMVPSGKV